MKYLIILDAGHAQNVEGKEAPDKSFREWDFNNDMQYKLKKRIEEHGISVYLTNPNPQSKDEMGLSKRATLANDYWKKQGKPQSLFISIHSNAHKSTEFTSARGTETYVGKNASSNAKKAAKCIQDEIVATMKKIDSNAKDRGVKSENFTVIYKVEMPSILIEYAFYTNHEDLYILKTRRDDLVEATVKGICNYLGIDYKIKDSANERPGISNDDKKLYAVCVGAYNKENADKMLSEIKSKGYKDAYLIPR